jgi:hypothetical protein
MPDHGWFSRITVRAGADGTTPPLYGKRYVARPHGSPLGQVE